MKAYVPEPEIGRVKLGDPCRIYVDAFPDRPFSAFVGEISPRSEFTPKEVQTRDERVKQVFAVKLFLSANPQHMLVPGMPARRGDTLEARHAMDQSDTGIRPLQPPGADDAPAVAARALTRRFGAATALAGIDLTVRRGEFFGLIGPDGVGKSTLLKAMAGVLSVEGLLSVLGEDLMSSAGAERAKARIGFLPQGIGLNLYPELSVDENLDYLADLRMLPPQRRDRSKAQLLAMTRLERFRRRPAGKLSGGMKQKLGLCCALIGEPDLLLLDEPTTGVDPISRRDFWEILTAQVIERGLTAVVATSYLDEAERFERVAFMYGGRILTLGDPGEVRGSVAGAGAGVSPRPARPRDDGTGRRGAALQPPG